MNLFLLLISVGIGAVLGWAGVTWLQRAQQRTRTLRCLAPYVPAAQRSTPPVPKP